ncbi:MAG: aldo/keto reductase [Clostridiales bacterium]|nr:aldo/keto reductase [Clostridiales bacterium]
MDKIRNRQVLLPDGSFIPKLGQGTWKMGEDDAKAQREIDGLRYGIRLGLNLLDSAEMYGDGKAENIAGEAIRGMDRDGLYLVSKVYPQNANRTHIYSSLQRSLKLLGADYLDLYLLHWRGSCDLSEMVWCMEDLRAKGLIRRWGVSNFDVQDMEDLRSVPDGRNCCVNQVLYNLASRGIEYDLMPMQREFGIPFMAYSPVGRAGDLVTQDGVDKNGVQTDPNVLEVARRKGISVIQLLLAFAMRPADMICIPKAVSTAHIDENASVYGIDLTDSDLEQLERSFPAPTARIPMEKY